MLKELSKKDKYWRYIAYKICGCRNKADELVQEMYIRRYENDRGQEWNDYYIICTIKSIYLNSIKTNKLIIVDEVYDDSQNNTIFEPNDEESEILKKAYKLSNTKKELLELNYDYSLREIEKIYKINYGYVYKLIKQAREEILGDDIGKYKNKRLKFKKPNNGFKKS